jgi:hypothetical protein
MSGCPVYTCIKLNGSLIEGRPGEYSCCNQRERSRREDRKKRGRVGRQRGRERERERERESKPK